MTVRPTNKVMEALLGSLRNTFPTAKMTLDEPAQPGGDFFLDVSLNGQALVVQTVRPGVNPGDLRGGMRYGGYGVSSLPSDYGNSPDEFYVSVDQALARVVHLLKTGEKTTKP